MTDLAANSPTPQTTGTLALIVKDDEINSHNDIFICFFMLHE